MSHAREIDPKIQIYEPFFAYLHSIVFLHPSKEQKVMTSHVVHKNYVI